MKKLLLLIQMHHFQNIQIVLTHLQAEVIHFVVENRIVLNQVKYMFKSRLTDSYMLTELVIWLLATTIVDIGFSNGLRWIQVSRRIDSISVAPYTPMLSLPMCSPLRMLRVAPLQAL